MPCEHFQDALIEAAVSGVEPQGELRVHLKNCASCQAAFEREQSLYSAIDSGMRVVANAEVPTSLVPRVRAAIDEIAVPKAAWSPKWFVLAGAGGMLAFFFITQTLWRARFEPRLGESAGNPVQSMPSVQVAPEEAPDATTAAGPALVSHRAHRGADRVLPEQSPSNRSVQPETLVPRDQEALLARYAEEWRGRKPAPLVVADASESTLTPLQVAPIQIAELDVKPLAESPSQLVPQ